MMKHRSLHSPSAARLSAFDRSARSARRFSLRLLICVLLCAAALLSSCASDGEHPNPPRTAATESAPTQPVTEAPTEKPTEKPTEPPTEPPTQPFSAIVIDDVRSDPYDAYDASGFVSLTDVIENVKLDLRYYSDHNFVGERINGYEEPIALVSKQAAKALQGAADGLRGMGYGIVVYDAYRPQRAVDHFAAWAGDYADTRMKAEFYPDLDKSVLFDYGYIAYRSGHSRGSTVDISLYDLDSGEELDMGGSFDLFSAVSHPDYGGVTEQQYENRMTLRSAMTSNGFSPLSTEWWHFTLDGEPYPDTYFDFPVSSASLTKN